MSAFKWERSIVVETEAATSLVKTTSPRVLNTLIYSISLPFEVIVKESFVGFGETEILPVVFCWFIDEAEHGEQ